MDKLILIPLALGVAVCAALIFAPIFSGPTRKRESLARKVINLVKKGGGTGGDEPGP